MVIYGGAKTSASDNAPFRGLPRTPGKWVWEDICGFCESILHAPKTDLYNLEKTYRHGALPRVAEAGTSAAVAVQPPQLLRRSNL